jgi:diguanylate cyclase (GGDEF)-like protein
MKRTLTKVTGRFGAFLAGLALASYIIVLLFLNFYSHTERNQFALEQMAMDLEKRSEVLSYFFSERKDDMENLIASRELTAFFSNQALGMSMEYGLQASLIGITNLFSHTIEQKKVKNDYVYEWIAFVSLDGSMLAGAQNNSLSTPIPNLQKFVEPVESAPTILIEDPRKDISVFISAPYFYKSRYMGQLIARLNFISPLLHFVNTVFPNSTANTCIATIEGCIQHASLQTPWFDSVTRNLPDIQAPQTAELTSKDNLSMDAVIARAPVEGTPLSLIKVKSTSDLFGTISPDQLIAAMGLLAALILLCVVLGIRVNTENLVLRARFEETEKQQKNLEHKNLELEHEIGKRMEGEKMLNHLAHHDPLTNLPNQLLLQDRLKHNLRQSDRHGGMLAVLFLDLDRFKNVNDTLGHPAGDDLLRATAKRLSACLRKGDTIARLGGDEFIVILEFIEISQDAAKVAQELLDALARPFNIRGREVFITASIGISLYPGHGDDPTDMVMNADAAMYRAKALSGNNYQFYSTELTDAVLERFSLENSLRRALDRDELRLHYQPQFSFPTGEIVGVEALVRWEHPQMGLLFPDQFIPLAEETGFIDAIGEWVLQNACRQAKHWQSLGLPALRMAVNLASSQIMNPGLLSQVRSCLAETGIQPRHLELEITESSIMSDPGRAIAALRDLRALGIGTVIDDFGTGYSSMSYLKRFSLTKIKIDRSFVQDIPDSSQDAAIIKAIITLGHSLSVKVNSEGVESEEQVKLLQSWGCDEWQGYLFSKPVSGDDIEELINNGDHSLLQAKKTNVVNLRQAGFN